MNLSNSRILVTGAKGMLGTELVQLLPKDNLLLTDYLPADYLASEVIESLDICDEKKVNKLVADFKPDVIFNCAAYTNVDLAEKEVEQCFKLNAIGPQNLANSLKDSSAVLVHVSTDYVFGSAQRIVNSPFTEEDSASPCGVYGMSKYLGDRLVSLIKPNSSLIVRTSWLHGRNGQSFVDKIIAAAKTRKEIRVVSDQIGSPTWAPWLSEIILKLVQADRTGIYNASSVGGISWFDFAKEIVSQAGIDCMVLPQTSSELARPAPRPAYSVLDVTKLESTVGAVVDWRYGVVEHFNDSRNNK